MFQHYALFPHMRIRDNVGYALMVRKVAKAERDKYAGEMLALLRLPASASACRASCRAASGSAWRWRAR